VLTSKHEQKQVYVPSGVIITAQIFGLCNQKTRCYR